MSNTVEPPCGPGTRPGPRGQPVVPPSAALIEETRALLRAASAHWRGELVDSRQAVSYLRGRGISGALASRFGLGYAPNRWRGLDRVLERHTAAAINLSGLLTGGDPATAGRLRFDRFRDRIIFPITTGDGELAGFGGRRLNAGGGFDPKYLNSPEGPTFSKRQLLYGLNQALPAIARSGFVVVTEGYFDVLTLAQHGLENVVATLGTACGPLHILQLLRVTNRIVFCFDGDEAGRAAAAGALAACAGFVADDRRFDFVTLPAGHDPDSFVGERGIEAFMAVMRHGLRFLWFLISVLAAGCSPHEPEGRVRIAARAAPFFRAMSQSTARHELLDYCAALLRESPEVLAVQWSGRRA